VDALSGLGINGTFLLSQAVNFLIVFGLLTVLLWKPAMRRLQDRREMLREQQEKVGEIAQARAEIDRERTRILDEARAEANRLLAEARNQARETVERAAAEAREKSGQVLAQARAGAEQERDRLLGQMRGQIAALAIAAAHRVVGEALDEERQRELVDAFFSGVREGRVEVLPEDVGSVEGPVTVTSAVPLTEKEQAAVRQDLATRLGRSTDVTFRVDPHILGGLVVRVGDWMTDGSMAGQLEQLRQTLA